MDSSCCPARRCWFSWLSSLLQTPVLLAFRLIWGVLFFFSGLDKFYHLGDTITFFQGLQIPNAELVVYLVATIELVGGVLLVLGYWTRFAALVLALVMVGAYLTADRAALEGIFTNFRGFMAANSFSYLLATLTLVAFGPGCLSLDKLCCWRKNKECCKTETSNKK